MFKERVKLGLSHLGPNAAEDKYYQDVIKAHRQARADRKEETEELGK